MEDYRTKGERIAYLRAEMERLDIVHQQPWMQEIKEVCIDALKERIEMIVRGAV